MNITKRLLLLLLVWEEKYIQIWTEIEKYVENLIGFDV